MDPEVPRPGRIYQVAAEHRRALLAGEREAAARMVRAYGETWRRIQSELEYITQRIEEARRAGEEVRASWLFRQRRWQALNEQVLAEVQRFERQVEESVRAQQAEVVAAAQEHAREQAQAVAQTEEQAARITTTWNRLPVEATEDLVGFLSDGSPLRTLLDGLGEETSAGVQRALLTGLMTGQNPRKIARLVRQAFGVPLSRALTISRTEVLRAYRESTRRTYQENRHLIRGWRWLAAHQPRTCAMCLAMDGSIHSLDEPLDDHPNGRCAMTPVLVDEEPPARETGEQWLERQSQEVQERVLGKAGAEAYRAGAVTLQDFVGRRRSEEWGTTRYAKSLREILGPEEALKWRQEAWEKGAEARKARREARKAAREAAARERDHQAWAKMQASWVRGSSRKQSVLLKVAVKEEFGLPQEVWKRGKHKFTDEQIAQARVAVRRMYEETQEHLKQQGISSLHLYRGIKSPVVTPGTVEAWTTDLDSARKFGEYGILEEDVPASRILAYSQGPGWVNGPNGEEFEHLVLGETEP